MAGGRAGTARSVEASAGPGNCAASTCHGQKTYTVSHRTARTYAFKLEIKSTRLEIHIFILFNSFVVASEGIFGLRWGK